jgi:DeoR/GlpR family transcriptional regulator of sugar metabolism
VYNSHDTASYKDRYMQEGEHLGSPETRRERLLAHLAQHDRLSVGELRQLLGVSEVTIRKDLDVLEQQGHLNRVHGGAVFSGRGRLELYFAAREQEHLEEKRRIATAAAALIHSEQRIFLDASTTALQIARLIKDRENLTVMTNGLYTALELSFCEGITVIVVGGIIRRRSSSLVGHLTSDLFQRLHLDTGFFGARGVTAGRGLTDTDLDEANLKQRMVQSSGVVIGVADSGKFGVTHFCAFALPHEVDRIITDSAAPAPVVDELRAQDIIVDLV